MKRALAAAALLFAACDQDVSKPNYEYMPDMASSVPYDAFAPNPNTPDGKTLIAPAKGTVARGRLPLHYGPGPDEAARAGRELKNPYAATPDVLARGGMAFQRYCSPCHGHEGLGDGLVTQRFPNPPSLLAEHARSLPDGQIFHIVSYGQGLMASYSQQVTPEDRWKIVHYVRAMQAGTQTAAKGATP